MTPYLMVGCSPFDGESRAFDEIPVFEFVIPGGFAAWPGCLEVNGINIMDWIAKT